MKKLANIKRLFTAECLGMTAICALGFLTLVLQLRSIIG